MNKPFLDMLSLVYGVFRVARSVLSIRLRRATSKIARKLARKTCPLTSKFVLIYRVSYSIHCEIIQLISEYSVQAVIFVWLAAETWPTASERAGYPHPL